MQMLLGRNTEVKPFVVLVPFFFSCNIATCPGLIFGEIILLNHTVGPPDLRGFVSRPPLLQINNSADAEVQL